MDGDRSEEAGVILARYRHGRGAVFVRLGGERQNGIRARSGDRHFEKRLVARRRHHVGYGAVMVGQGEVHLLGGALGEVGVDQTSDIRPHEEAESRAPDDIGVRNRTHRSVLNLNGPGSIGIDIVEDSQRLRGTEFSGSQHTGQRVRSRVVQGEKRAARSGAATVAIEEVGLEATGSLEADQKI
ncbi:MAG: hypothetical protein AB7O66_01475 [Limisphaerales bacterium]